MHTYWKKKVFPSSFMSFFSPVIVLLWQARAHQEYRKMSLWHLKIYYFHFECLKTKMKSGRSNLSHWENSNGRVREYNWIWRKRSKEDQKCPNWHRLENQPTNYFLIQGQPWVHVRHQRPILQHADQVRAGDTTLNHHHPLLQIWSCNHNIIISSYNRQDHDDLLYIIKNNVKGVEEPSSRILEAPLQELLREEVKSSQSTSSWSSTWCPSSSSSSPSPSSSLTCCPSGGGQRPVPPKKVHKQRTLLRRTRLRWHSKFGWSFLKMQIW